MWVRGRKNILEKVEKLIPAGEKIIWIHCASLGEFEQGRPLIEKLRENYPGYRILLSFFSPSGYEVQKDYPGADWVIYLPLDGPRTAKRFIKAVHPSLVIFVKYEFWYYYLKKIKYRNIPLILISAYFTKDMSFFRWHGAIQRKMLSRFDHLFVQDKNSKILLDKTGLAAITSISGDTRFDRVLSIATASSRIPFIEEFTGQFPVIVAGSTWPEDEQLLQKTLQRTGEHKFRLIIAPHEITPKHLDEISSLFPGSIRFSDLNGTVAPDIIHHARVMIIDSIGLLSRLYKYGSYCYVGGGLKPQGVHNVLEAAVFNKVVFFGPFHKKYREAVELLQSGGAICIQNETDFSDALQELWKNTEKTIEKSRAAGNYIRSQAGATQRILDYIQEKRLLTS
jgi:3-deoxy-D-manno-octulosonic-acid transferase